MDIYIYKSQVTRMTSCYDAHCGRPTSPIQEEGGGSGQSPMAPLPSWPNP